MSYPSLSCARLFSTTEVRAAFAALDSCGDARSLPWPGARHHCPPSPHRLLRFASHREHGESGALVRARDHFEVPLGLVLPSSRVVGPACAPSSSMGDSVREALPAAVLHVLDGLYEANAQFVAAQLTHESISPSARRAIWDDVGKKSVLRLLRYQPGTGCRPHVDPGLATALLMGSADGLEVFESNTARPPSDRNGDYSDVSTLASGHWRAASSLLAESGADDDDDGDGSALLLRGRMLQVLSRQALPGVLHRVTEDWKSDAGEARRVRYNIVVELRPANAKKWYAPSTV